MCDGKARADACAAQLNAVRAGASRAALEPVNPRVPAEAAALEDGAGAVDVKAVEAVLPARDVESHHAMRVREAKRLVLRKPNVH